MPTDAQQFFDLSLDMFVVANFDGYFITLNPAWEKVLGWTTTELCSKPFIEFVHPEDQDPTRQESARVKEGGMVLQFENRYRHKDGSWRHLSWRARPEVEKGRIYAVARDITIEKSQAAERERLLSILDLTPDLVGMATADGRAIYHNRSGSKYLGDKILGKNIRDVHPQWALRIVQEQAIPWATKHGHWEGETAIFDRNGNEVPVWQTLHAHKDERGELAYLSTIMRDLSQQKADRARTVQASKLAALGEMASGIAHEINNPLAIILGKSGQIRDKLSAGKLSNDFVKDAVAVIETTTMRISKIVRGLRTLSRSSEADPLEESDLAAILEDTLSLCLAKFQNTGIDIRQKGSSTHKVCCRPAEISQVLLNLLNNARDAIEDQDEKWIELEFLDKGEEVELRVTDSGNGIPSEVSQRMMEPFFTTKGVGKGTGLGLSISQGIMAAHQGSLIYNKTAENTQFILRIPKRRISLNSKPGPRSPDRR